MLSSSRTNGSYGAFDLARSIYEYRDRITEVKIILFTNGTIRSTLLEAEEIDGVTFIPTIWDLERIYRVSTSGAAREKIEFDLMELAGKTLEAIKITIPEGCLPAALFFISPRGLCNLSRIPPSL